MVAREVNRLNEGLRQSFEQPVELVKGHPLSSVLLVFGIGMGVGVLLSQTVCSPLLAAMEPEPTMTERVRKQLYEAVSQVIPPSMLRQIQSYTS